MQKYKKEMKYASFVFRKMIFVYVFVFRKKIPYSVSSSLIPEYERLSLCEKGARNEFLRTFEEA
jgi:hypothetical protein